MSKATQPANHKADPVASRLVSDAEIDRVIELAADPDAQVRYEVAHALSNIAKIAKSE